MVKFNVAVESQPAAFVPLQVYVPLVVYVVPFHKKLLQTFAVEVDTLLLRMVKFNVITESQPTALVVVKVRAPEVVYVNPVNDQV
jgi:hypothetical protein